MAQSQTVADVKAQIKNDVLEAGSFIPDNGHCMWVLEQAEADAADEYGKEVAKEAADEYLAEERRDLEMMKRADHQRWG